MDILSKIDELVLDSSIRVLKIEFAKDSIAIMVEELNTPAMTYKCINEADAEFTANLWRIKPFLDSFKMYGLPTEQDLERQFEVEKWEYFRNIPEDEITEDAEDALKKQIMARPSVEKIRIKKIELKQHKNQDDSIIWYYQITCISVNRQTMFMEEDQCVILESLIPPVPDKKMYGDFQNTLEQFFRCGRNHYLAYIKYLETEREEKKRRYILEASQGNLFNFDTTDFERSILTPLAKSYFPEKFKGLKPETVNISSDGYAEILDEDSNDSDNHRVEDMEAVAEWAIQSGDPVKVANGQLLKNEAERKKTKKIRKQETSEITDADRTSAIDLLDNALETLESELVSDLEETDFAGVEL